MLAMRLNYLKATKIAARTGQVFAAGFVLVGLGWNPMLLFIGLFVFTAARQELDDVAFREQIEQVLDFLSANEPMRVVADELAKMGRDDGRVVDHRVTERFGHVPIAR